MSTMYAETFQKIYEDLTAHDVSHIVLVKDFYHIAGLYSPEQKMGCLRAFAQKDYIEFRPEVKDLYHIKDTDTFYLTAPGIDAWNKWFSINPDFPHDKPQKEDFIILQTKGTQVKKTLSKKN